MFKRSAVIVVTVVILFIIPSVLLAAADIVARMEEQKLRIDQGITSGELSRGEADILQTNLLWIRDSYLRMKSDGRLTLAEQERLETMLNRNSRMIYNKKHNPIKNLISVKFHFTARINSQQLRINEGVASGELTRAEADIVQDNLHWIRDTYLRMKADGKLTAREQTRLENMLNDNSRMIYNKKHNPVRRLY